MNKSVCCPSIQHMPSESRACFRFGQFEVDALARVLRKEGVKIRLQEQPFQVLLALIEEPGKIVTREDLCQRVWPEGVFVEFDHALNTAVKKIRAALCDDAAAPRYIETVPRRGYRFLALVDRSDRTGTQLARHPSAGALFGRVPTLSAPVAMASVLAIALLSYGTWRFLRFHRETTVRVAILPFNDMKTNSLRSSLSAEFSQALAEQLEHAHSKHLAVSAHTLREREPTANANLEQGPVEYVVEGGIFQDGPHVHVAVQLVRIRDQNDVWREDFDREFSDGAAQETAADVAPTIELAQVFRVGNERYVHRLAERALAKFNEADAIARCGEFLEIAEDLRGVGYFEIITRCEAEILAWRGHGRPAVSRCKRRGHARNPV